MPQVKHEQTFEMRSGAHTHGVKIRLPSKFLIYNLTVCLYMELTPLPR